MGGVEVVIVVGDVGGVGVEGGVCGVGTGVVWLGVG